VAKLFMPINLDSNRNRNLNNTLYCHEQFSLLLCSFDLISIWKRSGKIDLVGRMPVIMIAFQKYPKNIVKLKITLTA